MRIFVPLDAVQDNPFQPRKHYGADAILELAESIEREGQIQAPLGRLTGSAGNALGANAHTQALYRPTLDTNATDVLAENAWLVQLAVGHRRGRAWRLVWERFAARMGDLVAGDGCPGLAGVPAGTMPVDLQPLSDERMFAKAVEENRHRVDISAVESAEAMLVAQISFSMTEDEIGRRFGVARSTVAGKLRLLRLPDGIKDLNREGRLSEQKCRQLLRLYSLDADVEAAAAQRDAGVDEAESEYWTRDEIVEAAEEMESAAEIAQAVDEWLGDVRHAAAQARREREPAPFADDQVAGEPAAAQGERYARLRAEDGVEVEVVEAPEAEPAITQNEAATDLNRLWAEYYTCDQWCTDASMLRTAEAGLLEGTLGDLHRIEDELGTLLVRVQASPLATLTDDGPSGVDRLTECLDEDRTRYRGELSRRSHAADAEPHNVDGPNAEPNTFAAETRAEDEPVVTPAPTIVPKSLPVVRKTAAERLGLPAPVLDEPHLWSAGRPVWPDGHERAGKQMLSKEVFEAQERYHLPVLERYGVEFVSSSNVKESIVFGARQAVQYVANLRCAHALVHEHLEAFAAWCEKTLPAPSDDRKVSYHGKYTRWTETKQRDALPPEDRDMVWAASLVMSEFKAVERLGVLADDPFRTLDDAALRAAGAFCYHLFHAEASKPDAKWTGEHVMATEARLAAGDDAAALLEELDREFRETHAGLEALREANEPIAFTLLQERLSDVGRARALLGATSPPSPRPVERETLASGSVAVATPAGDDTTVAAAVAPPKDISKITAADVVRYSVDQDGGAGEVARMGRILDTRREHVLTAALGADLRGTVESALADVRALVKGDLKTLKTLTKGTAREVAVGALADRAWDDAFWYEGVLAGNLAVPTPDGETTLSVQTKTDAYGADIAATIEALLERAEGEREAARTAPTKVARKDHDQRAKAHMNAAMADLEHYADASTPEQAAAMCERLGIEPPAPGYGGDDIDEPAPAETPALTSEQRIEALLAGDVKQLAAMSDATLRDADARAFTDGASVDIVTAIEAEQARRDAEYDAPATTSATTGFACGRCGSDDVRIIDERNAECAGCRQEYVYVELFGWKDHTSMDRLGQAMGTYLGGVAGDTAEREPEPDGPHTAATRTALANGDGRHGIKRALWTTRDGVMVELVATPEWKPAVVLELDAQLIDLDRALALVDAATAAGDGSTAAAEIAPEVAAS